MSNVLNIIILTLSTATLVEDVHVDEAYLTGPVTGVQSVATGLGAVDDLLNTLSG